MNRTVFRGLALSCAVALLAAAAACNSGGGGTGTTTKEPVPGVTDTEILVGSHQPLTGPAAAGYSKISPATKAYFDYVNANGGVYGRKITYKYVDDGYNPATTQQVVRKLVLDDKVFAILNGLGTPTHTGVLDFLKTNKVPDLFVASGATTWDQPTKYGTTFGYQTDYTTEGKILGNYAKTAFAGKKACFFGQDDDFGRDSLAGVEKGLGASVVAKQNYVTSNTNVGPQIGALKAAGCEVVFLATIPGFTALALGTAAKIGGFAPQWIASGVGGDYNTVSTSLGAAKGLLNGFITAGYLPNPRESANPWNVLFQKINKDYNGNVTYDGNQIYGMSVGYLFVSALQKAGKDLTREGLVAAIEGGGFKGPGLAPLLFSKTSHAGYGGARLSKVTGEVQEFFGPAYTTDKGAGAVTEYTDAPATPPANGIPTA